MPGGCRTRPVARRQDGRPRVGSTERPTRGRTAQAVRERPGDRARWPRRADRLRSRAPSRRRRGLSHELSSTCDAADRSRPHPTCEHRPRGEPSDRECGPPRHVGESAVVVLSNDYWQNQFGGDPDVVDRTLVVNGQALTIIGVAPAGFSGVVVGQRPQVFVPLTLRWSVARRSGTRQSDHRRGFKGGDRIRSRSAAGEPWETRLPRCGR